MEYKSCRTLKKKIVGQRGDYKFECVNSDDSKVEICVYKKSAAEDRERVLCKGRNFDGESDCSVWVD